MENIRELVEKLALCLNQPLGINMNISYETLMNSSLEELFHFIKIVEKYGEKEK
ncbi:hypothetical protein [uncultured Fusobacterium sp.]|uniref:hypothetical protein n=1 Tax=uncultured Fusobacterium sp. TaxID=159267 RepID=UPI0027DD34C5|nr:hypothetical protein [uncultured Fusobacterium sp.]